MNSYLAIAALFIIAAIFFLLVGAMLQFNLFWMGLITIVLLGTLILFKARG